MHTRLSFALACLSLTLLCCAQDAAERKETPAPAAPPNGEPTPSPKAAFDDAAIRAVWTAVTADASTCPGPDGPARVACQLQRAISVDTLTDLLAVAPFASGPGAAERLSSQTRFGHYDKTFVRRLRQVGIPALFDDAFLAATQAGYTAHLKPHARLAHRIIDKMKHNLPWRWDEARVMQRCMEAGTPVPLSYYAGFMREGFIAASSAQGVHRACDAKPPVGQGAPGEAMLTAFWIRRWIDGTALEFDAMLSDVLALYDPAALTEEAPAVPTIGD